MQVSCQLGCSRQHEREYGGQPQQHVLPHAIWHDRPAFCAARYACCLLVKSESKGPGAALATCSSNQHHSICFPMCLPSHCTWAPLLTRLMKLKTEDVNGLSINPLHTLLVLPLRCADKSSGANMLKQYHLNTSKLSATVLVCVFQHYQPDQQAG